MKQLPFKSNPTLLTYFILFVLSINCSLGQSFNIKNDVFWDTQDGQPIYSQGGGIFKFPDPLTGNQKYYWYGVHYRESDLYRHDPTVTQRSTTFESVTCYSSTDLIHWKFEADVVNKDEVSSRGRTWMGRLGVAYIKELKKYAMVVQHGNQVLFLLSDTPAGQFKWHQEISMLNLIGTTNTGDQTVFTDEDTGKSYLIYSYGRGRNKIYVSEIGVKNGMVNLLDCKQVFQGEGREGNCMFKYKGKYYMAASNLYGWDASLVYYLVADDIRGPYLPANNMNVMNGAETDYGHITQTGFFYTLKGSKEETVIYCGDRWADFAGNGLGYNQWVPLSFKGDIPHFNSLSSWNLNSQTGEWKIAEDNNFVKNGSFEADRKRVPSTVKPVQTQLTGWQTTVIKGNSISLDSAVSPVLNYINDAIDRKEVIGEKSLNMTDNVPFKREITQIITSSTGVKLPNGVYTLKAKIKNSAGFNTLQLFAEIDGKRIAQSIIGAHDKWVDVSLKSVNVKGGTISVGFLADGNANAFCLADDVSFVKAK